MKLDFQKKLLASGIASVLLPLSAVGLVAWIYSRISLESAREAATAAARSELTNLAKTAHAACDSNRLLLERVAEDNLKMAIHLLERLGGYRTIANWEVRWRAVQQVSGEVSEVTLPAWIVGAQWLGQIGDFSTTVTLVDEMKKTTGVTSTILQRMNEEGDMLRIATSVPNQQGGRGLGTYISHQLADGSPNPLIQAVLQGRRYVARAMVVGEWYVAAYEPLKDRAGKVIGLLYVGLPESEASRSVKEQLKELRVAQTGSVVLFNIQGADRGKELLGGAGHGEAAKAIIAAMERHKTGTEGEEPVLLTAAWSSDPAVPPKNHLVSVNYFQPWDWVVAVTAPEEEVLAVASRISTLHQKSMTATIGVTAVAILLAAAGWLLLSRSWTGRLRAVVAALDGTSRRMRVAAGKVAESSQVLAVAASRQGAALEEMGASLTELSGQGREAAERTGAVRRAAGDSVRAAGSSSQAMERLDRSMQDIGRSGKQVTKVLHSINEIALQTNLLALNAAVEAARAGEAGQGFAVVADGVRALAARCAAAAEQTAQLIGESMSSVREGAEFSASALGYLTQIADSARALELQAESAASGASQQSLALDELQRAIQEVSLAGQENAAHSEESARAAEELKRQSDVLVRAAAEMREVFLAEAAQPEAPERERI